MAIKSNKKIDFEYEYGSGDSLFSVWLRLYEAPDCGMSIGILDENGDIAISFPVSMFSEITEFLISQGIIEGKAPSQSFLPTQKTVQKKTISLPKPRLVSSSPLYKKAPMRPTKVDLEQDDADEFSDYPEEIREQLIREQERLNNIQSALEGATPTMSLSSPSEQEEELPEEEAKNMLEERKAALNRSKAVAKKIKRRDDEE